MVNKTVDPTKHLDDVDEFFRKNEAAIKNLAAREKATGAQKPTESLPTESMASGNKKSGKATQTEDALDKLKVAKNDIRTDHEKLVAERQQKQTPQRPGNR